MTQRIGVVENHEHGLYTVVLYRGGEFTQYLGDGRRRTSKMYPVGSSVMIVHGNPRHQVIAPVKAWLCENVSGRFSVKPHWTTKSHIPITLVFHDSAAAMLFKMRWL